VVDVVVVTWIESPLGPPIVSVEPLMAVIPPDGKVHAAQSAPVSGVAVARPALESMTSLKFRASLLPWTALLLGSAWA
jgi:hypothetical protein